MDDFLTKCQAHVVVSRFHSSWNLHAQLLALLDTCRHQLFLYRSIDKDDAQSVPEALRHLLAQAYDHFATRGRNSTGLDGREPLAIHQAGDKTLTGGSAKLADAAVDSAGLGPCRRHAALTAHLPGPFIHVTQGP
eukprot:CAMPEP_0181485860 /NCGR_PEP_ID=MMETSP1110-20121109/46802_1 /TAXON_ID=174948 /ORGANISM="Symbiodinium sp., Strain CCMP421" /LENGTH=134 /DNA_ID=CAMNT_0023611911 /DNA_START=21 /DNA_END=425 /DNA_ORIENTATION=-